MISCEQFQEHCIEYLYGEKLDDHLSSEIKLHRLECIECNAKVNSIETIRNQAKNLLIDPVILAHEEFLLKNLKPTSPRLGMKRRFLKFISLMGSYVMQPQLAMGMILVLVVGSSLLFLRKKHDGNTSFSESPRLQDKGTPVVANSNEMASKASPTKMDAMGNDGEKTLSKSGESKNLKSIEEDSGFIQASPPEESIALGPAPIQQTEQQTEKLAGDEKSLEVVLPRSGAQMKDGLRINEEDCTNIELEKDRKNLGNLAKPSGETKLAKARCFAKMNNISEARKIYSELLSDPKYKLLAQQELGKLQTSSSHKSKGNFSVPAKPNTTSSTSADK